MKLSIVYVTAKDEFEARRIGRTLLDEKLAACVNIYKGVDSMYMWEGLVKEHSEVVVLGKTRDSLISPVVEKIKEMHSYESPCIVSVPITGGSTDYLNWIAETTE